MLLIGMKLLSWNRPTAGLDSFSLNTSGWEKKKKKVNRHRAAGNYCKYQSQKSFIFLHGPINQGSYSDVTTGIQRLKQEAEGEGVLTRRPFNSLQRSEVENVSTHEEFYFFWEKKKKHFLHRLFLFLLSAKCMFPPSMFFLTVLKNVLFELT